MERPRREMIRANVTVDSRFSGDWLDVNEPGGRMKSLQMMRKGKRGRRGRKEKKAVEEASWRSLLSQSDFMENVLDFQWSERFIPECLLWRAAQHAFYGGFFFFFYVSLYFYNVFVSPRQVQIFTPVKDAEFCSHCWKRESKRFTFIVLPKRGEKQNDSSEYAADDGLSSRSHCKRPS